MAENQGIIYCFYY